jgi:hypothetical protein
LIAASNAEAVVYKCVTQEGLITYQDVRCATLHPDNKALPITVNKRLKNRPNQYTQITTLIKKKEQAAIHVARQQQQALKKTQSAKAKAQRQTAWHANRCEHAKSQKAEVEATLRHGYRATQERHLRERLKKIEDRERRYCQTTRHH